MPQVGFICPVDQVAISTETCLACACADEPRPQHWCDYSYEFLKGMANDDDRRATAHFSTTMLSTPCPRQTWLLDRVDYHVHPMRMFPAFRGTMGHLVTEQYPEPGYVYEQRFELPVDMGDQSVMFTGQIDAFNTQKRRIRDFKTKDSLPDMVKEAYIWQLNCYRYLLYYGSPQKPFEDPNTGQWYVPGIPAKIEIDTVQLHMWNMSTVKRYPTITFDLDVVRDYITSQLASLMMTELPLIPKRLNPIYAPFCRDWCPVRDQCLEAKTAALAPF